MSKPCADHTVRYRLHCSMIKLNWIHPNFWVGESTFSKGTFCDKQSVFHCSLSNWCWCVLRGCCLCFPLDKNLLVAQPSPPIEFLGERLDGRDGNRRRPPEDLLLLLAPLSVANRHMIRLQNYMFLMFSNCQITNYIYI